MRTTEYEAKKEQAVKLSVLWAKTGLRELSMRNASMITLKQLVQTMP